MLCSPLLELRFLLVSAYTARHWHGLESAVRYCTPGSSISARSISMLQIARSITRSTLGWSADDPASRQPGPPPVMPPAMAPADASPSAVPFGHQVGREAEEKEQLAAENFDLRLQVQCLRNEAKKRERSIFSRRLTADGGQFYDFCEEDAMAAGDGAAAEEDRQNLDDMYKAELERLRERVERAEASAGSRAAAAEAAEREAGEADAAAREARREAAAEHAAAENAESERRSVKAELQMLQGEMEAVIADAEKADDAAKVRADGLEMQVGALEEAVGEARRGRLHAEAEMRGVREKLRVAEVEVTRLQTEVKAGGGGSGSGSCGGGCTGEVRRLEEELRGMHAKYDAMASNVDLRRMAAHAAAACPLGEENESVDLSLPGFELYKRLCEKVASADRGGMVVLGDYRSRQWRTTVLNEMNDGLNMLYRQTEKLEDDRALFIEKYCRVLVERQRRAPLQERKENRPAKQVS